MYKSFRVKNFRCFKDLQINDLGRVNLIAGKNNTGKTALLEAMYTFTRPLSPQVLFELQGIRTGSVPTSFLEARWKQLFRGMNASGDIEFCGQKLRSESQSYLWVRELQNSEDNAESFLKYFQYLTEHGIEPVEANGYVSRANAMLELVHVDEEGIRRETQFLAESPVPVFTNLEQRSLFVPVRALPAKQFLATQLSFADISGELGFIEEVLNLFEPDLSDLRLLSPFNEAEIWANIGKLPLPVHLMGGGVNQACNFMLSLIIDPECLFIDEIENGFHHSVQRDIWRAIGKLAAKHNVQVFATTHSIEMVRAAYEAFKDDDPYEFRYHRLDRKRDGNIEAVTYNRFGMDAVAAFDFEYEVRG